MISKRRFYERLIASTIVFGLIVNYALIVSHEGSNNLEISSIVPVAKYDDGTSQEGGDVVVQQSSAERLKERKVETTHYSSDASKSDQVVETKQTNAIQGENDMEDEWSAKALMEKNEVTMLTVPMEKWPSFSPSNRGSCPFNLSFYVPDLPETVTTEVENFVKGQIKEGKPLRTEVAIEFSLLQLFRTSACRAYNASEADLIIFPYMHSADCDYNFNPDIRKSNCGQVRHSRAMQVRFNGPKDVPLERQIYLSMGHESATSPFFRFNHVKFDFEGYIKAKITTGDRQHNGVFAMPLVSMTPRYQPSIISKLDEAWWTRPRKYAFAAIYGGLNEEYRPYLKQPRCFRLYFFNHLNTNYPDESNFAETGLPYLARMGDTKEILAMSKESKYQYEDSILCPILAGDSPFLTRFFDVILKGCIPVVMEWELFQQGLFGEYPQKGERKLSWWIPDRVRMCRPTEPIKPRHNFVSNIIETYPFISSLSTYNNTNDPTNYDWSIDYRSFVITAKGKVGAEEENQSDMRPLFEAMESALKDPSDIRRRQLNMKKYATRFTLGVGLDAHKYDDSFAGILKLLELYKDGL